MVKEKTYNNISEALTHVAEQLRSDIAIKEVATGRSAPFFQANKLTNQYASYLQSMNVGKGDRVLLMVQPSIDFICLTFSLFKLGAIVILIDPGMGITHLKECIAHVEPKYLIGVPKALFFKKVFPQVFKTVIKTFCCGNSFGLLGPNICKQAGRSADTNLRCQTEGDDLAAIIFTSGSTGIPKGVHYNHKTFAAQLRLIRDFYKISPGDRDQPAFPFFSLFSIALGATVVIPDMDSTKPAKVDAQTYVDSLSLHNVNYSFGSPALWRVVSKYCQEKKIKLNTLQLVLIAGAPVSGKLIARMLSILPEGAKLHTPYGATECLPIASIEGHEIVNETWPKTRVGRGICVGSPLPGIEIRVIRITDDPIPHIDYARFLDNGEIGEIIVSGDVVTTGYDGLPKEDQLTKIANQHSFYHRMGDTGYFDNRGRLWFCGRKSHRVVTVEGTLYPICCEAITNEHPLVFRSALVGIVDKEKASYKKPVLIVEPAIGARFDQQRFIEELKSLAAKNSLTSTISHFLIHSEFPVDIRHNAKIVREELAIWAESKMN